MSSKHKKRKTRPYEAHEPQHDTHLNTSLFIQAHEADLLRGPQAISAARSLEAARGAVGDGLIRWSERQAPEFGDMGDDDHVHLGSGNVHATETTKSNGEGVWVDRYAPHWVFICRQRA